MITTIYCEFDKMLSLTLNLLSNLGRACDRAFRVFGVAQEPFIYWHSVESDSGGSLGQFNA